ncbi:hypothetical protein WR25_08079 [Diploscapter pachys]|uniref:RING-type domain-containing protein n=1 Tax=Diploscapter pachys TaxID=2018661 RepID=A0A2A2J4U2_9BILA|nr:hypothetical protein WR25_08079 [Diploscapter pachys]
MCDNRFQTNGEQPQQSVGRMILRARRRIIRYDQFLQDDDSIIAPRTSRKSNDSKVGDAIKTERRGRKKTNVTAVKTEDEQVVVKKEEDEENLMASEMKKRQMIIAEYLENKLDCPICYNVLHDPIQSDACRHVLCSCCYYESLTRNEACPICNKLVTRLVKPATIVSQMIEDYLEMDPGVKLPMEEIARRNQRVTELKAQFERRYPPAHNQPAPPQRRLHRVPVFIDLTAEDERQIEPLINRAADEVHRLAIHAANLQQRPEYLPIAGIQPVQAPNPNNHLIFPPANEENRQDFVARWLNNPENGIGVGPFMPIETVPITRPIPADHFYGQHLGINPQVAQNQINMQAFLNFHLNGNNNRPFGYFSLQ